MRTLPQHGSIDFQCLLLLELRSLSYFISPDTIFLRIETSSDIAWTAYLVWLALDA